MGLLIAGTAIMAQDGTAMKARTIGSAEKVPVSSIAYEKSTVLWSNDFSNPADWVMDNTSNPALDWSIETDPTLIPVPELNPAAFTSVSNGYAFINSDGAGQGATQNANMTADTLLDLTGVSMVGLRYENSYRTFEDRRTVRVSADGGTSWTEFVITEGLNSEANHNTANPEVVTLNISSVAANQDSVKIQFHYEGNWGWYWAIDDVAVIELDAHDLEALETYGADKNIDFEYSQIPLSQARPLSFGLIVKNSGGMAQTHAGVDYDISDGSSSVETGSFGDTTIAPMEIDTLFGTSTFTPSALGTYTFTLTAKADSTDAIPANNSMSRSIDVTNYIWALDYGTDVAQINQANAQGIDSTDIFKIGNQFFSQATDTIWSVDVELGTNPNSVGNEFFVEIREWDGSVWNVVSVSPYHTVTASEPGTVVNVDLTDEVVLTQGSQIIALACHNGGAFNERVSFARSGLVAESTVLFVDPSTDGLTRFGGKQRAMRIRLNLDRASNTVNVEENLSVISVEQNMPNPAVNNTMITYSLDNNTDVELIITDMNGKVVKTLSQNNQVKGTHVFNVNVADLASGVYQYTLKGAGSSVTKSMVVTK